MGSHLKTKCYLRDYLVWIITLKSVYENIFSKCKREKIIMIIWAYWRRTATYGDHVGHGGCRTVSIAPTIAINRVSFIGFELTRLTYQPIRVNPNSTRLVK
jgi:hypothetical protein